MKERNRNSSARQFGMVLAWLCCGAALSTQVNGQGYPPPVGAGIVATLEMDQAVYTNQPAMVWCPPCVTNIPPCMLPCYLVEQQTAIAQFVFAVTNQYKSPRAFEFSSGQQFDIEIIDQTGLVVAAWSDGTVFSQAPTSFTLDPGQTVLFNAKLALQDREGKLLNGVYDIHAFLTTSGPQPPVEATRQIAVTLPP